MNKNVSRAIRALTLRRHVELDRRGLGMVAFDATNSMNPADWKRALLNIGTAACSMGDGERELTPEEKKDI